MDKGTIKQLASFAVINTNGGDRLSYTYDELDAETGDIISANNKGNFYVVDDALKKEIEDIKDYIRENRLKEA